MRSVSSQSCPDIEIIVVNDNSTDNTRRLLGEYAKQEPRLHLIDLDKNVGAHLARASGVMAAKAMVLGFLDADDWFHQDAIKRMLHALEFDSADTVICGIQFSSREGELGQHKLKFAHEEAVDSEILRRFCDLSFGTGSLCNKLYRREVLEPFISHDFGETVAINEDYIVNFGVFSVAKRVCLLPDSLYYYRQHSLSVTASPLSAKAFAGMLRAYVLCLETYSGLGHSAREQIDILYARQLRFECYRVSSPIELEEFSEHLAESLKRLADIHPTAIYKLIHLFEIPYASPRNKFDFKRLLRGFRRA